MNITERQAGRQSSPLIEQISQMSKSYGVKVKYLNKVVIVLSNVCRQNWAASR